jgi:hypothetical protein
MKVFEFENNIIQCSDGIPLTDSQGQITVHSNNIFYGGGTLVRSNGVDYVSSNLVNGYESSARSINPLFNNSDNVPTGFTGAYGTDMAPNTNGFSLRNGSPGINGGIALSSDFAGSINSVHRPVGAKWDVGAYQHRPERSHQ